MCFVTIIADITLKKTHEDATLTRELCIFVKKTVIFINKIKKDAVVCMCVNPHTYNIIKHIRFRLQVSRLPYMTKLRFNFRIEEIELIIEIWHRQVLKRPTYPK